MAKAKSSTSKKGRAAKAAEAIVTTLRRSPRKAAPSAKKSDNVLRSAATKVEKKTPPVKKASPAKNVSATKNANSPAKKASTKKPAEAKSVGATRARSTSVAKPASPASAAASAASPRPRGRPKKATTTTPTAQARGRSNKAAPIAEVPPRADLESWTDSPEKRSRSKGAVKAVRNNLGDESGCRARQASLGGIRKSIEVPSSPKVGRGRSKSPDTTKKSATSRGRGRPKTPAKKTSTATPNAGRMSTRSGSISIEVDTGPSTTRSPMKASPRASKSIHRVSKPPTKSRTTSPVKSSSRRSARGKKSSKPGPSETVLPTTSEVPPSSPAKVTTSKARVRSTSVSSVETTRARSKSPTKTAPQSPSKRTASNTTQATGAKTARSRSRSPVKTNVIESVHEPHSVRKVSRSPSRARSTSPTKRSLSNSTRVPKSPSSKARIAKTISARTIRTRSKSPTKPVLQTESEQPPSPSKSTAKVPLMLPKGQPSTDVHQADTSSSRRLRGPVKISALKPSTVSKSPTRSLSIGTKTSRSASRTPDLSPDHKSLKVEKARASRSPAKGQVQGLRMRSLSPVKSLASRSPVRRLSAPTISRKRSESPQKTSQISQRNRSNWRTFDDAFNQGDDYGIALRRIESAAYKARKQGEEYDENGDNGQQVTKRDYGRARHRGIRRAELELNLHAIADNREQRVRDGYGDRVVRLPSVQRNGSAGRRPSFYEHYKDQAYHHQPSLGPIDRSEHNEVASPSSSSRASPAKSRARSLSSPRKGLVRSQSIGSRRSSVSTGSQPPLQEGRPSAPYRGSLHSITNPEFIEGTNNKKKNPFFETMPAPEVWHRRMPPYFTFGETPFMERVMSRQINDDLSKGKDKIENQRQSNGYFGWLSLPWSKKATPTESKYKSPWQLPEVSDADVEKAARQIQRDVQAQARGLNRKRSMSPSSASGSAKRARRRSWNDDEYRMSGAL